MSEKFNVLQSAMASSERIFKLLDEPVAIESPDVAGPRGRAPARGHIVFDDVWFAYNGRRLGAEGESASTSSPASASASSAPPARARRR